MPPALWARRPWQTSAWHRAEATLSCRAFFLPTGKKLALTHIEYMKVNQRPTRWLRNRSYTSQAQPLSRIHHDKRDALPEQSEYCSRLRDTKNERAPHARPHRRRCTRELLDGESNAVSHVDARYCLRTARCRHHANANSAARAAATLIQARNERLQRILGSSLFSGSG